MERPSIRKILGVTITQPGFKEPIHHGTCTHKVFYSIKYSLGIKNTLYRKNIFIPLF